MSQDEGDEQDRKIKDVLTSEELVIQFSKGGLENWILQAPIHGLHISLQRPNGVYVRCPLNDPRNGTTPGLYFYASLTPTTFQRVRIFCDENGFISGEIHNNTVENCLEYWTFIDSFTKH